MSKEQLQELKEKAKLWDSLSPILKTIHGSKFERPNGGVVTIENTSNASSHVGLLEEESKEMMEGYPIKTFSDDPRTQRPFCPPWYFEY